MALTITDQLVVLIGDGTVRPLPRGIVSASPSSVPIFATVSGLAYEIQGAGPTVITNYLGVYTIVLPWNSECSPNNLTWELAMPDGTIWGGTVPEGVSGPVTVKQLKDSYGWGLVAGPASSPITVIQGPAGQSTILDFTQAPYNANPNNNPAVDSALSLLAAIAALPATGGTVWMPRGIYYFNSLVTSSKPGVTIRGEGEATQIISTYPFSAAGQAAIGIGSAAVATADHCKLESFLLQRSAAPTAAGSGDGIRVAGTQLHLSDVHVKWFPNNGFTFDVDPAQAQSAGGQSFFEVYAENLQAEFCGNDSYFIGPRCFDSDFVRCLCHGGKNSVPAVGRHGFNNQGTQIRLIDCHPYFHPGDGYHSDPTMAATTGAAVTVTGSPVAIPYTYGQGGAALSVGVSVTIDSAGNQETITVLDHTTGGASDPTPSTFYATCTRTHLTGVALAYQAAIAGKDVQIKGGEWETNAGSGLHLFSLDEADIEGIVCYGNLGRDIELNFTFSARVRGSTLRSTASPGVGINGGQRNKVQGCEITGSNAQGVRLEGGTQRNLISGNHIHGLTGGNASVKIVDSQHNEVFGNTVDIDIAEQAIGGTAPDYNRAFDNSFEFGSNLVTLLGAHSKRWRNFSAGVPMEEASGTATIPSGSSSVVVTHGLALTPAAGDLSLWPANNPTNTVKWWLDTITATQFTIHTSADPGASGMTFGWQHQTH